jgi:cytochrome c-type biogenesis protein
MFSSLPFPIAAFFAGVVSFLSPCVLPLVPGYVSLISGASVEELKTRDGRLLGKVLLQSVMFILGFTVVFVTLGATASYLGQLANAYKRLLAGIGGVIVIVLGLHLTGIFKIKWLFADARFHSKIKVGNSPIGAFLVGFTFAFGWSPCIGPILTPIINLAALESSFSKGVLLLFIYSMGLAVPFLLTSLLIDRFMTFYGWFRRYLHVVEVVSGVILIAIGILLVTNRFTWIATQLGFLNRLSGIDILSVRNVVIILAGMVVLVLALFASKFFPRGATSKTNTVDSDQSNSGAITSSSPLRNVAYVLITVIAITILLFAGKYMSRGPGGSSIDGRTAPEFDLKVLGGNGKTMKLSALKGKAVLVDFWATYCEPCKIEMPWIAELQKQYGPQGFQVIGVDMDPEVGDQAISSFAQKMGVNYPILLGTSDTIEHYGGDRGLPVNFFIDRSGNIVASKLGVGTDKNAFMAEFEENIKKSLGQGGTLVNTAAAR